VAVARSLRINRESRKGDPMHVRTGGIRRLLPVAGATVVALLVVAACTSTPGASSGATSSGAASPAAGGASPDLAGTSWQLNQLAGPDGKAITLPDAVSPTLDFGDGTVSGNAGCNQFNGSYTLDGGTIKIGPLASTQKACPQLVMTVETAFMGALEAVTNVTMTADTLSLSAGEGSASLVFAPQEAMSLTGTGWQATGVNNGNQAVQSLIIGTDISAVFGEDGTVAGSGGCNAYHGTYTTDGTKIDIGPLGATLKLCNTPDGVDTQEQQFFAAMDAATTYAINGDTLELRDDSGALQVSFIAGPAQ
jgi:heat shock protein HslJ